MPASVSVFLNTSNIEKAIEFYSALGFKVVNEYRDDADGSLGYVDLELDGAELGLGAIEASDDDEFRSWVSTPLGAGVIVTFTVPDVDAVWKKVEASRLVVESPIADRPYGRLFMLNDPDGYVVSFLTEPKRAKPRRAVAKARKAPKKAPSKARKVPKRRGRK